MSEVQLLEDFVEENKNSDVPVTGKFIRLGDEIWVSDDMTKHLMIKALAARRSKTKSVNVPDDAGHLGLVSDTLQFWGTSAFYLNSDSGENRDKTIALSESNSKVQKLGVTVKRLRI